MEFEKYTERSRGFIQSAQSLALREGHQKFTPDHVLKVLLDDEEGLASGLIKASGGDARMALASVEAHLAKMPKVSGGGAGHSSHAASDFRKICNIETYSVYDNVSELTARVNDEGWICCR